MLSQDVGISLALLATVFVSLEILRPYISDQFCVIAYNRRETDNVDNSTGCSPMFFSTASLRRQLGERFDLDRLFGLLRSTIGFRLSLQPIIYDKGLVSDFSR